MALADLAEFAEAEAACGRARALDPESPWAYSVTSSMESMRGRLAEALKWNDAALKRGNDIMAIQEERARWLLGLGLLKDAGAVVQRALDADAAATRANPQLMLVGAAAAIDSRGSDGLHEFLRDNGLQQSSEPALLFEAANAALMVSEPALARQLVDAALASKSLQPEDLASPWAVRTGQSYLLVAAAAMRASGDTSGAQQRLQQLAALLGQVQRAGVSTSGMYELQAQLAAMRGDADAAMQAMRRAVALGWSSVWQAEHQPYFESIRTRSDFRALLDATRARNLGTAEQLRARLSAPLVH
jgi:tetratricopeptide (TPR) repeat protein